jgi:tRNA-modifying protein YgfZ
MVARMGTLTGILLDGRGVLALGGAEARALLQGLITNDIQKVSAARAIYAALLTPQGKFLHDFLIAETAGTLLFDCEGPRRADLLRRLMMYRLRAKVDIRDATEDWAVAALIGEGAGSKLGLGPEAGSAMAHEGGIAFVDPRLAGLGVRLILPKARADAALNALADRRGAFEDYEAHRLALGVPDGSRDIEVEKTFLLEANAEALHAVDFDKGCYVGQELTARTKRRANLKWRLYPVAITGRAASGPVTSGGKDIGALRTAAAGHGLAYLRIEDAEAAEASGSPMRAGDAELTIRTPDWLRP